MSTMAECQELGSSWTHGDAGSNSELPVQPRQRGSGQILQGGGKVTPWGWRRRRRKRGAALACAQPGQR